MDAWPTSINLLRTTLASAAGVITPTASSIHQRHVVISSTVFAYTNLYECVATKVSAWT
jgi:hypothetical protein